MKNRKSTQWSEDDPNLYRYEAIEEAKKILGEKISKQMTDEEIHDQIANVKYLVESWLDEYERKIFDVKTLQEKLSGTE